MSFPFVADECRYIGKMISEDLEGDPVSELLPIEDLFAVARTLFVMKDPNWLKVLMLINEITKNHIDEVFPKIERKYKPGTYLKTLKGAEDE
jgi:hypothetical protein